MSTKTTVKVDSSVMLQAIARSTQMSAVLLVEAQKIATAANQLAATEVGQVTGGYAGSFKATVTSADAVFQAYNSYDRRKGRKGSFSPIIEGRFGDNAYRGSVGIAYAKYLPALFIEVGAYNKPGKYILTRAATDGRANLGSVAAKAGKWKANATTRTQRYRNTRDARAFESSVTAAGGTVPKQYVQRRKRSGGSVTQSDFNKLTRKRG
jgi:hypothetical protein